MSRICKRGRHAPAYHVNLNYQGANADDLDIGSWTVLTPVPLNPAIALNSIQQPGTRLFYISTAGGIGAAQDAAGAFYLWNGTSIVDQTGSTTGAGGVPYGTDPINPTGPIKPYSRWAYVGPTRNGNEIGRAWGGANNNVGAERFSKTNRYDKPDWWMFKRGDTFDVSLDILSHAQETSPGTTAISDCGLAIPGGASASAMQYVGAYGSLATARPRFIHPQGGGFMTRSLPSGAEAEFRHALIQSIRWDGHDRTSGIQFNKNFSGASEGVNVIFEDVWSDGAGAWNIQSSHIGKFLLRRVIIGDTWAPANANLSGLFFSGQPTATLRLEDSILYRNGFRDGYDPALFWPPVASPTAIAISIASPAVVSWTAHGKSINDPVQFTSTGSLPTGIVRGTRYYVIAAGFGANSFQVSTSVGGAAVNTSGPQSGVHHTQPEWNIFDRNLYLSGTCDHKNSWMKNTVSLLGASGDQFRHGWNAIGNFFLQGYVGMGSHGGDASKSSGSIVNNVLQTFKSTSAHPGYGLGLNMGAHNVETWGNIISRAQDGQGNFTFGLSWTAAAGVNGIPSAQNRIRGNFTHDNIFESGTASYVVDVQDGGNTSDSASYDPLKLWRNPGLENNSVSHNVFIYANPANPVNAMTKITGLGSVNGLARGQRYNAGTVDTARTNPLTGLAVVGNPPNEYWTLTATSPTSFNVVGSVSGAQSSATVGVVYQNAFHRFTIDAQAVPFNAGDTIIFGVTTTIADDSTRYFANRKYASVAAAAAAENWPDASRTLKTYLQAIGETVTSSDGMSEYIALVATMQRGRWRRDLTAKPIINHIRQGRGLPALA